MEERSEVGGRKSEIRSQRSEVRGRRTELVMIINSAKELEVKEYKNGRYPMEAKVQ